MLIPLTGFAPDLDPSLPGIITDCSMMLPTIRGYKGAASLVSLGFPALSAACNGAALCIKLDASSRMFAGTATKIYETGTASWTDVSGAVYTGGADSVWRFAQHGNITYAVNRADAMQSSTAGAFAAVAGAPKATVIEFVAGFVFVAATVEATYGDQSDRWWCSAYLDGTDWTPSVATQCTTGRLVDVSGDIKALRKLGSDIVVYKQRGLWLGRYVGAPAVWDFILIPGEIGAVSQEAVVDVGGYHVFIGYENVYRFDGSRPIPIGDEIKEWFFADLNAKYKYKIRGTYDRKNALIYFYYPNTASTSGALNSCLVYNHKTEKWGRANRDVETSVEFLSGQLTYENLGTFFATYDDINAVSYDSAFFNEQSPVPALFDTAHKVYSLTGASLTSSITTGDFGDDDAYSLLTQVRARYVDSPTTATMTNYYRPVAGDTLTTGATVTMSDGKFDVLRSSRFHRLKFEFTGDVEMTAYSPTVKPEGTA
jgi:hypothetical protein